MGWVFVIALAIAALAGLKWTGHLSRMALELAVVAALVGIAGYAWQGSPNLPGSPRAAKAPN